MGFAVRLPVLCVLLFFTAGAAAPPQAGLPALLSRMRAANGGLLNAHVVSTSRHVVDGVPGVLTTNVQNLRYRQDQCTGSVCLGTYFDGERLYSVNINDTALPRSPAIETQIRALRILAMLAFIEPKFAGAVEDGGTGTFHGRPTHRIFVSEPAALPMKVYVDPQTGLVQGAQDVNGDATYLMRDYRRVGAFKLPFEIDRNGVPLETYLSRRIEETALAAPQGLSVKMLRPGVAVALDAQSISPLASCVIGGTTVPCLIDSGNSAMAMSVELAEQLNVKPVGMLRVTGLGNYATEVVRAGPLTMGGVQFGDAEYIVLSDIHRFGYDLVVGADVLAAMPVTIDYKRHELYFDTNAGTGGTAVSLEFQNFVPVVNVTLGDSASALAVDTGDQSNINLGYDYYQQHTGLFQATKTRSVSGVGGESVELIGEIGSIRIGTLTAENQHIGTTRTLHGTADGHLGAGFLSKYRVVLDYAHEVMRLLPPLMH